MQYIFLYLGMQQQSIILKIKCYIIWKTNEIFFYRKKLCRVTSLNNNVFISLSTFILHHNINVKSQDQFY